jgi:hypothetical protein
MNCVTHTSGIVLVREPHERIRLGGDFAKKKRGRQVNINFDGETSWGKSIWNTKMKTESNLEICHVGVFRDWKLGLRWNWFRTMLNKHLYICGAEPDVTVLTIN